MHAESALSIQIPFSEIEVSALDNLLCIAIALAREILRLQSFPSVSEVLIEISPMPC